MLFSGGRTQIRSLDRPGAHAAFSGRAKRFAIINLNAVDMVLLNCMGPLLAQTGCRRGRGQSLNRRPLSDQS
jgi:hypothetical protein